MKITEILDIFLDLGNLNYGVDLTFFFQESNKSLLGNMCLDQHTIYTLKNK